MRNTEIAFLVKTADIDIKSIGMRSRAIKRVNAANPAESMFGNARIKRIGCQNIFAA